MKLLATFGAVLATAAPVKAAETPAKTKRKHVPGCRSESCDKRIGKRWALKHRPVLTASSTSYCPGSSGTVMADGTGVRFGSVASNRHPLGTTIRLKGQAFLGRAVFVVRDRIGHSSELDFWAPSCSQSFAWGRRVVRYVVVG